MDRQTRIGLVTLLLAALTIIAVVSPEDHRSTTNTAILDIAEVAAVGSVLALVLGSVPFRVLRKDLSRWWNARPRRKWSVRWYAAEPKENELEGMPPGSMIFYTIDEKAVRDAGVPCLVIALEPRTLGDALEYPLERTKDLSCTVKRHGSRWHPTQSETRSVAVATVDRKWSRALGRWPDDWFDEKALAPAPGRYRVRWRVDLEDERIAHPTKRFGIADTGEAHVGRLARAVAAVWGVIRHFRGLE